MASNFFFPSETYKSRRQILINKFATGKILLLGNEESSVNFEDNWYPFRQDSTFLYYIGINLPSMAAIIDIDNQETILFGDDTSIDMVIWTGPQTPLSELGQKAAIQKVLPLKELENYVDKHTMFLPRYRPEHTLKLEKLIGSKDAKHSLPLIHAIVSQRNIKSEEEIVELDKAVSISARMHKAVIQAANAGMKEYELVGVAQKFAADHGTRFAYPAIMTIHGETLHNHYYGNTLSEGDVMLYDGGVELESGYCGDLTRTFPVSKKFTELQAAVYNTVRNGYLKAREISRPGIAYKEVHFEVCKILAAGLIEIGWMKGNAEEAVNAGAHTMFFQHGLGHMMGLDVHDMENFGENYVGYTDEIVRSTEFGSRSLRLGKKLETGNVITNEPGIYVIPQLIDKFQSEGKFKAFINYEALNANRDFGGIRIEDDFLITASGNRQLGDSLTTELKEIEVLRG